ncbi:MAG: Hsp70 family protein [Pseudomonadota bacterium]|nr:Hsp70 family protein [Pseudomonadota bacterium]
MSEEGFILGIDLGTTFSAMAYVDRHGKPVILPNGEGQPTTPSVIHFYDREACVVGEEAVKMVVVDSLNVVRFIKRAMGEPNYLLEFFGRSYSPQELSAIILRKLKDDAEEALGFEVKDAVITVPAYFNSAQRGATHEAGTLAGFNVLSIINEPTAAAIAYGVERLGVDRNILVFDLGGGTFDVTVMEIRGTTLRTIATDGNAELGGKDFDDRLLNHVAEQFLQKFGLDPRDEPQPYQELYERCLHAKISLSSKPRAVIPVNFRGHRSVVPVTREEFDSITRDLVEQCADTCAIVLEKAKMRWSDIDDVLLAGGSTRMPMIQDTLRRLSGKVPVAGVNPDECVALGASLAAVFRHRPKHPAIQAYRQAVARRNRPESTTDGKSFPSASSMSSVPGTGPQTPNAAQGAGLPGVRITDVASHPLGIVVLDSALRERIVSLIPQFTPLPCEKRGRFAYAYDGMTAVRVEVTEGVGELRDEVTVIGEVILDDLPPRPRGTPIEVVYRYTLNQILEVDVTDVETRQTRRATILLRGGLSDEGMEAARKRMASANIH